MLWRRALVLIVVGFLHAMLLYIGDILAAYGVLLLVGAWVVWWRDRWLLGWAAFFFVLVSLPSLDSGSISTTGPDPPSCRRTWARCSPSGCPCTCSS